MLETELLGTAPATLALCPPELRENDDTEAHGKRLRDPGLMHSFEAQAG
jgi:hypothetical protein